MNEYAAKKSHRSGELAERLVKRVFGVEEPHVEIKAAVRSTGQVKFPLVQLEQQHRKTYIIVVYDRGSRTRKRGPRKGTRTHVDSIEEAFTKPVTFIVLTGSEVIDVIHRERLPIERIQRHHEWSPRILARVAIGKLKGRQEQILEGGHTLYGFDPTVIEDVPF